MLKRPYLLAKLKLLKLPMSYFDTKLMGDLLERMHDHNRIEKFLTTQSVNVIYSFMTFLVCTIVINIYDLRILCIFLAGSLVYGIWILSFLKKRKT